MLHCFTVEAQRRQSRVGHRCRAAIWCERVDPDFMLAANGNKPISSLSDAAIPLVCLTGKSSRGGGKGPGHAATEFPFVPRNG